MANKLASETSPYLLQHAHNPVDWHPWGAEALDLARRESRPILLSVGYSACHWCHVLERESFSDPVIADLMNSAFVNIKVDREERPDIDQLYMKAVQAMTGSGGWPLTVFLTPMQEPYYGGTYFPPEPRHGLPSFRQVLHAAAQAWTERPDDVRRAAGELLEVLRRPPAPSGGLGGGPGEEVLDLALRTLSRQHDAVHGGFGRAPKFPQPVTLELLLRQHLRTGDEAALAMCVRTLDRMAAGGLRDHLGGGFHRYSVDERWLVPHFEKMLYDNALLARAYADAFRVTGAPGLRAVAEETLDYLAGDMQAPGGGFYTARDADSEGHEGLFYVWTPQEIGDALDAETARLFVRAYGVTDAGNFEGRNILYLPHPLTAVARAEGLDPSDLERRLARARATLLERRAEREPPFLDDKILTSWNGLALRAFAEAGSIFGRADYVQRAGEAAAFLLEHLHTEGRLRHTFRDGRAGVEGFLEDYGAVGNGLLSLYEASLNPRWLEAALWCCESVIRHFWDDTAGYFYDTADDGEPLVVRPRDAVDNATPSGTSLAAELLARAGHLLDRHEYLDVVDRALAAEAEALQRFPTAFGRLLSVLDRRLAPPTEVAVVGDPDDARTRELLAATWARLHRNLAVAGGLPAEGGVDIPFLRDRGLVEGGPAAYVCRAYACRAPVATGAEVAQELGGEAPSPPGPTDYL
jgi:uncharacterized protein YyaL (SSP411 family)